MIRRGMDHAIHGFSAQPTRPDFRWPGGRRVAVYLLLHLEHTELQPPEGTHRDPRFRGAFFSGNPDWTTYTQRDYGNRIGAWRILELLDRLHLPASVAVNLMAAQRHPELVAAYRDRGYEPVAHGLAASRMTTGRMTEAEEAAQIARVRDELAKLWPGATGWLGQDHGATPHTTRLLAEAGFDYGLDWANDEEPYLHASGLLALPPPGEWDDVQTLWLRRVPAPSWPALVAEALDRLLAEPRGGRVLALGIHPWLLGAPHRIRYLGEALADLARRTDLHIATVGALAIQARAAIASAGGAEAQQQR
ncbi:polysaccharide deacetylase family protein [Roseomonas frigidaquae]|uniref:Chitooligosaccharide deacetylase n=1 Tax=Falsiroseomonas frigidaquae TaxID=487318 RepID=A0ABX1F561_9PROT|nr:polysaccharide deacetylase family protein [Falsiroseomonas frigidaquae]NKE47386.1 polysaccharide deacetylase family protein [Falsiroseomonas frigidaquae]